MKIAVVSQTYSPFLHNDPAYLARGLGELGHEVQLITTSFVNERERPYASAAPRGDSGLPFEIRKVPHYGSLWGNALCSSRSLGMDESYDAVLLSEDYPVLCQQVGRRAARSNIPVLITLERYSYPKSPAIHAALALLDLTLHRYLWARATILACHSSASVEFLASRGAPRSKTVYMPGCVDASYFREQSRKPSRRADSIGEITELVCVARLHPYKGIRVLLYSTKALISAGHPIRLTIIGRGPHEREYKELAHSLGIELAVSFITDPIPHVQIPDFLNAGDIYVQPSLVEPFGMAVCEAMASGKAIVGSAVGGIINSIVDGETGILVRPNDSEALVSAVELLIRNPKLRTRMGAQGQSRALELMDYRKVSARYERLIRNPPPRLR